MNKTFYKYAIFLAIVIVVCLSTYFFLKDKNNENFEVQQVHVADPHNSPGEINEHHSNNLIGLKLNLNNGDIKTNLNLNVNIHELENNTNSCIGIFQSRQPH